MERLLIRAIAGPASLSQHLELMPYGTDYERFEFAIGREANLYGSLEPLISAWGLRFTPFWDLAYDRINGGVSNMASNRHALLARGGVSFRFGTSDNAESMVKIRLGIGGAKTQLNDGKGISPPGDWAVIGQAQLSLNYVLCYEKHFCFGPDLGFSMDDSSSHSSASVYLGFIINPMVSPSSGRWGKIDDDKKPPVIPPPTVITKIETHTVTPVCPENPEVTQQITKLHDQYSTCVAQKEEIQREKIECQKGRDAERDKCEKEKLQCQEALAAIPKFPAPATPPDPTKPQDRNHIIITSIPDNRIRFQNDEVDLFPQKFPGKQEAAWGLSNQYLDDFIRMVNTWVDTLGPDHKIELKIRGFANDTGKGNLEDIRKRNRALAKNRAEAVFRYLTGRPLKKPAPVTRDHIGREITPLNVGKLEEIKGANGETTLRVSGQLRNDGPTIIITTVYPSDDPKDDILRALEGGVNNKKALKEDVENPIWRMALIDYRVTKITPSGEEEISVESTMREVK